MTGPSAATRGAPAGVADGAAAGPGQPGHFGPFGGRYAPEALMSALEELAREYAAAKADPVFTAELDGLLRGYAGRPTLVTEVPRFAARAGDCRVLLKREDLAHTGSHKINNVLGQALLTKRMGKKRVIAETGPASTGSRPRRRARCWAWSAWSTWARRTPSGRRSTWPGCGCSALRWSR